MLPRVYWPGEPCWLGKLLEHPENMSQGETLGDVKEHVTDAYRLLVLDDGSAKRISRPDEP
jgi:hypothetical protein